jgi:hypothetical protein
VPEKDSLTSTGRRGGGSRRRRSFRDVLLAALRALGEEEMPARITVEGGDYVHRETLKHTFFSATGLYEGERHRAVFKFGRCAPFFGVPLGWIGRWLTRRELLIYRVVDGIAGVPRCVGAHGDTGFGHLYIGGHPMRRSEVVGPRFFPELYELLAEIHNRDIAYVDLSKAENILVGDDDRAYLIDFGIAWSWREDEQRRGLKRWLPDRLGRFVLAELQQADRFHLLKHWRRAAPETMSPEQMDVATSRRGFIRVHELFRRPYRQIRARVRARFWKDRPPADGEEPD